MKLPLAVALDTEVSREEIEVAGQQLGEREKRAESREREQRERESRGTRVLENGLRKFFP